MNDTMSSQNCTQTASSGISQQGDSWLVFVVSLVFIIGFYKLLRIFIRLLSPLSWIPCDLHKRYATSEIQSWALVTGASQGIGLAFALQLAKLDFNIIIMSRSQSKLKQAKEQIEKTNPRVQVKHFPVDFQKLRIAEQYEQLMEPLKQFDISILVNNVGVYNSFKYLDNEYQKIKRQAIVNLIPITCLTRLLLPIMLQRNKRFNKRSAIVNISSGASQAILSHSSHYCATKAYDDLFTRTVEVEYRKESVDFLSVRPYLVTSSMTRNQSTILHVSVNQCAKGALKDLGKYSVSYGHFYHRIQGVLIEEFNGKIMNFINCMVNKVLSQKYRQIDQRKQ